MRRFTRAGGDAESPADHASSSEEEEAPRRTRSRALRARSAGSAENGCGAAPSLQGVLKAAKLHSAALATLEA